MIRSFTAVILFAAMSSIALADDVILDFSSPAAFERTKAALKANYAGAEFDAVNMAISKVAVHSLYPDYPFFTGLTKMGEANMKQADIDRAFQAAAGGKRVSVVLEEAKGLK